MMRIFRVAWLAAGLLATVVFAEGDRDFLSTNETEQVREAQEPNARLLLYLRFARQRLDLANHYLQQDKPGRSLFIHNALEDYGHIIEAIDLVADDGLRRNLPIEKGMQAVVDGEKTFLDQLNKITDSSPKDLGRYKFVLDEAINTTSDSRELSMEDRTKRQVSLTASDEEEKKNREANMSQKEQKERRKAAKADGEDKKVPSLLKPGEKPPQL